MQSERSVIRKDGIKDNLNKVQVMGEWPRPTKVSKVQQFMGFLQYMKKLIHHSNHIAATLTELIKGKASFHWGEYFQ